MDEAKFESNKLQKENLFLMNRIESLELEKQELANKGDNLSEKSYSNVDNDLAGIEGGGNPREEIEDLKDEILEKFLFRNAVKIWPNILMEKG